VLKFAQKKKLELEIDMALLFHEGLDIHLQPTASLLLCFVSIITKTQLYKCIGF